MPTVLHTMEGKTLIPGENARSQASGIVEFYQDAALMVNFLESTLGIDSTSTWFVPTGKGAALEPHRVLYAGSNTNVGIRAAIDRVRTTAGLPGFLWTGWERGIPGEANAGMIAKALGTATRVLGTEMTQTKSTFRSGWQPTLLPEPGPAPTYTGPASGAPPFIEKTTNGSYVGNLGGDPSYPDPWEVVSPLQESIDEIWNQFTDILSTEFKYNVVSSHTQGIVDMRNSYKTGAVSLPAHDVCAVFVTGPEISGPLIDDFGVGLPDWKMTLGSNVYDYPGENVAEIIIIEGLPASTDIAMSALVHIDAIYTPPEGHSGTAIRTRIWQADRRIDPPGEDIIVGWILISDDQDCTANQTRQYNGFMDPMSPLFWTVKNL